ncbi:MAG: hypothetical protein BWK76_03835 [Desulfobulbaceae bacterium A2]|nr:MAG: hypothetical protein BWK76_03835 [Desulfobulbaceae bacterium A2]
MNKTFTLSVLLLLLAGCAATTPQLNEPFALRQGETKQVGPDGFSLTLRSISGDSGCLAPDDCSTMTFNGSIVAQRDGKSQLAQAMAILHPGQGVTFDEDGYAYRLIGVRRDMHDQAEATFVVLGPSAP